jgi:hypothetical protein
MQVTNNKTGQVKQYQYLSDILNDEELNSTADGFCSDYSIVFSRKEALEILKAMEEDNDLDDEDKQLWDSMSNEELGDELCLSGCIHDESFDKVIS